MSLISKIESLFKNANRATTITLTLIQVPLTTAITTLQSLYQSGYVAAGDYQTVSLQLNKIQTAITAIQNAQAAGGDVTSDINSIAVMVDTLVNSGAINIKNAHSQLIMNGIVAGLQTGLNTLLALAKLAPEPAAPSASTVVAPSTNPTTTK